MNFIEAVIGRHPDLSEIIFYALLFCGIWTSERLIANSSAVFKRQHALFNIKFVLTALPLQLLMTLLMIAVMQWDQHHKWNPFCFFEHRLRWLNYMVLFLLLDLGEYIYHVLMHKLTFFWKFHLIHHSDHQMDVSTTLREHPVDTVARNGFLILWVLLLGPAIGVLLLRQAFQSIFNLLAHAEFRLPHPWHRVIGWVFITPNLHHVHHHFELPYTDCNYGDVLSCWDRLFGTYREMPQEATRFGVDTHMDPELHRKFSDAILIPFIAVKKNKQ